MSEARPKKRLVVVWIVFAVLVAAIVALELRDRMSTTDTPTGSDPRSLVPASIEDIGAVEVAVNGQVNRFERDAAGQWFYHGIHAQTQGTHAHQADPVLAKRIETALGVFTRTRTERQFPLVEGGKELGVAKPEVVILVYRPQSLQPLAQYAVGDVAPDGVSRYVLTVGKANVDTIPNYQIGNLLDLVKTADATAKAQASAAPR